MREGEKEVWDLGRTVEHTSLGSQEASSRGRGCQRDGQRRWHMGRVGSPKLKMYKKSHEEI